MTNPDPLQASFKEIADAFNEGAERAKLASTCKMRRFYVLRAFAGETEKKRIGEGVVFSDGSVLFRSGGSHYFDEHASRFFESQGSSREIAWIDGEIKG